MGLSICWSEYARRWKDGCTNAPCSKPSPCPVPTAYCLLHRAHVHHSCPGPERACVYISVRCVCVCGVVLQSNPVQLTIKKSAGAPAERKSGVFLACGLVGATRVRDKEWWVLVCQLWWVLAQRLDGTVGLSCSESDSWVLGLHTATTRRVGLVLDAKKHEQRRRWRGVSP